MNPTVISSIIGGVSIIIAAIVTFALKRSAESRQKALVPRDRRNALEGYWTGHAEKHYSEAGTPTVYELEGDFQVSGKRVSGDATSSVQIEGKKVAQPLMLSGGFLDNKYLKMDYLSRQKEILEFGCFIVELDSEGKVLEGRFVGYGRRTKGIISGTIKLKKAT
jgi:hypothetical protein